MKTLDEIISLKADNDRNALLGDLLSHVPEPSKSFLSNHWDKPAGQAILCQTLKKQPPNLESLTAEEHITLREALNKQPKHANLGSRARRHHCTIGATESFREYRSYDVTYAIEVTVDLISLLHDLLENEPHHFTFDFERMVEDGIFESESEAIEAYDNSEIEPDTLLTYADADGNSCVDLSEYTEHIMDSNEIDVTSEEHVDTHDRESDVIDGYTTVSDLLENL